MYASVGTGISTGGVANLCLLGFWVRVAGGPANVLMGCAFWNWVRGLNGNIGNGAGGMPPIAGLKNSGFT